MFFQLFFLTRQRHVVCVLGIYTVWEGENLFYHCLGVSSVQSANVIEKMM